MINITTHPAENGTARIKVGPFYDDNSPANVVTPTALSWSLSDVSGNIINNRHNVSLAPASTVEWRLTPDDLQVKTYGVKRILTITATYTSDLGSGNILHLQTEFEIEKFIVPS